MLKAVNAREFDMVASWSVDRLGRSLTDLLSILQNLRDKCVDLFLHQQGLDTSTTAGKAMLQMLGVFAEFERGIIRERVPTLGNTMKVLASLAVQFAIKPRPWSKPTPPRPKLGRPKSGSQVSLQPGPAGKN